MLELKERLPTESPLAMDEARNLPFPQSTPKNCRMAVGLTTLLKN